MTHVISQVKDKIKECYFCDEEKDIKTLEILGSGFNNDTIVLLDCIDSYKKYYYNGIKFIENGIMSCEDNIYNYEYDYFEKIFGIINT